jgi:hypothetical protein
VSEVKNAVRQARPAQTIGQMFDSMREQFIMAERELAAFSTLSAAYRGHTGEIAQGERKHGLPIFSYNATLDGVHVVPVVSDLKLVQDQYVTHVLVPLIRMHAAGAAGQVAALERSVARLKKMIENEVGDIDAAESVQADDGVDA